MKRLISIILALLCTVCVGSFLTACKEPEPEPSGTASLTYKIQKDGTLFVRSITDDTENVVIPEKKDGKLVTGICDRAFANNYTIKTVSLPSSVKKIGEEAFVNCQFLTTINLQNVKFIENSAFNNCGWLDGEIKLDEIIYIKGLAFYNCGGIDSVVTGNKCIQVHADAFDKCTAMTSFNLGSAQGDWFYYLVRTDETGDQIRSENYGGSVAGFGEKLEDPSQCAEMLKANQNPGVFFAKYEYFTDYCNYTFELEGANGTQHQLDYQNMFS